MRNIKLVIAYDGTVYHGFQYQANALSIQQVLEERLSRIFSHPLKVAGAGRTDRGVHAYGQVISFQTTGSIPVEKILVAARGVLPKDIVVCSAEEMPEAFHARYSAKSKMYLYRLQYCPVPDPFTRNYSWQVKAPLNAAAMHEAVQLIIGTHDFSSFRSAGSTPTNPVRTIFEASCTHESACYTFHFWGNGFLYHMVRNLVGTLARVGLGELSVNDFLAILAARDRRAAGVMAPAQGLYLHKVLYN